MCFVVTFAEKAHEHFRSCQSSCVLSFSARRRLREKSKANRASNFPDERVFPRCLYFKLACIVSLLHAGLYALQKLWIPTNTLYEDFHVILPLLGVLDLPPPRKRLPYLLQTPSKDSEQPMNSRPTVSETRPTRRRLMTARFFNPSGKNGDNSFLRHGLSGLCLRSLYKV